MRTDIQDRARTSPSEGEIVDVDTTTDTITDDNKIIRSHNEEEANDTPLQDDIPDVDDVIRDREENTEDRNTSQLIDNHVDRGDKDAEGYRKSQRTRIKSAVNILSVPEWKIRADYLQALC